MNGFLLRNYVDDIVIISDAYFDAIIKGLSLGIVYSPARTLLKKLATDYQDVIYISDDSTFNKVQDLIVNNNKELVLTMFDTLFQYEDKNKRDEQVKRITTLIK